MLAIFTYRVFMMNRKTIVFLALTFSGPMAQGAPISFDGIKCDSPIETVMLGRTIPNARVVTIEKKYQSLNLKLLWSDGMEPDGDPWTLSAWLVCGKEYLFLNRKDVVKDVLIAPQNVPNHKFGLGTCQNQGKVIAGTAVFVVPADGKATPKQFERIWTIDDSKLKFRETKGGNFSCEM